MGLRLSKPLVELTAEAIDHLPAQLGVYEITNARGATVRIGYAGGNEPFGMRTALGRELEADTAGGRRFRHEFTHGYLSRWHELLMVHQAEHGALPPGNQHDVVRLGTLSPLTTNDMTGTI